MSAYVEVIFDNTDGRFHNNGKTEFTLRRTIGAKKDEYSMDRKNATKREVFEMLEAAGLSRSNPFYIVPQGRVTAITNMKDEERLNMLKEISGSNVYEKRRADSLRLMSDTENRCERIDGLVNDISGRLQELEGEKKELEAWNKNDRERRALLYTMNARREAELDEQLEKIENFHNNGVADVDGQQSQFLQTEHEMERVIREIDERKTELNLLQADRGQLESDRNDAARQKAAIELEHNDLMDGQSAAQQTQRKREAALKRIRQDIAAREKELQTLQPQYDTKRTAETKVISQLADAEGQRKRLDDKQGRTKVYTSKAQRDDALRQRINQISITLATRKSFQLQTTEEVKAEQEVIAALENEVRELEAGLANEGDNAVTLSEHIQKALDAQSAVRDEQSILGREKNRLEAQLRNAENQWRTSNHDFSFLLDHQTSRGLETLQRLRTQHDLSGIHGTIAELMEVPEPYKIATEIAAGPSLFHVVCDDDKTSAKAIELLNKAHGGRLTFISLNRLQPRNFNIPQTADAQPLLPKLRYDAAYDKAFKQVFGKVVVCPELSICQSLARTHDVVALTPDGDRANKKGGYHGGYFDPSKSKLDAFHKVTDLRYQLESFRARDKEIEQELDTSRQRATAAATEVRKAQSAKRHAEEDYGPRADRLRKLRGDLQQKRLSVEAKRRQADSTALAVNALGSEQSDLEDEIASKFEKALSRDEETLLQSLSGTIRDLQKQQAGLSGDRAELESRKTEIELELQENLRPRFDQLQVEQTGAGGEGNQNAQLIDCGRSLKNVNKTIADLDRRLQELEGQRDDTSAQLAQLEESRAGKERANRELARQIERQQRGMEKSLQKRAQAREELQSVQADIRELGTLPEDTYARFTRWSSDKVC